MIEAAFWALVASSSLVVGGIVALRFDLAQRTIGLVMGFGAGVLIAVLSVDLALDAFERSSGLVVALGFLAGGLTFYAGDRLLDQMGGSARKSSGGEQVGGRPLAIVLGIVLDGIPESAAIGVTLLEGGAIGGAFIFGVFLSNLPESLAASSGLRKAGRSARWILGLWLLVSVVCAFAALLAFGLLDESRQGLIAFTLAFAAGAILAMLADTMMPEAFEHAGRAVALVTVLGFALGVRDHRTRGRRVGELGADSARRDLGQLKARLTRPARARAPRSPVRSPASARRTPRRGRRRTRGPCAGSSGTGSTFPSGSARRRRRGRAARRRLPPRGSMCPCPSFGPQPEMGSRAMSTGASSDMPSKSSVSPAK